MSEKERNLVEKSKSGDVEAFEQLIESCQKKVFNIAYRMIGNYDDANELAQEVFIKAFRSIKNLKVIRCFQHGFIKLQQMYVSMRYAEEKENGSIIR